MGPAPMIRMVEISVLLGIRSRGLDFGHKKRARVLRVPRAVAPGYPRRAGWSLDQIPHPRNPQKQAINGDFQGNQGYWREAGPVVHACAALQLQQDELRLPFINLVPSG